MRHSEPILQSAVQPVASPLGDRLPNAVKLYVDEVFDRTIVALHALLEPIGVDMATATFAPGFVAEFAAVVQVAAWEDAGLRDHIPLEFPPAATAMSDLVWRYHVDPAAFMDPAPGTAVFNRVVEAWAKNCHPDAREMLGADVVMAAPPSPAEYAAAVAPVIITIIEKTSSEEKFNDA